MRRKHPLSTHTWILLLAILFLAMVSLALLFHLSNAQRTIACIYEDGTLTRQIDLSQIKETQEFTLAVDGRENTIRVRPGGICMAAANCPDQTCVHQGWLESGITPIVCLPHRIVIRLESDRTDAFDVIVG